MQPRHVFIAAVAAIAIVTGAWLSLRVAQPPPTPSTATVLPQPKPLVEFNLIDDQNQPFTQASLTGQWDLVFFGFTNCPDICPLTLQRLNDARAQAFEDGDATAPRIVLVSVDPERDRPDNLAAYVNYFGDNIVGVTGDLEQVQVLTDSLGIWFGKNDTGDGNYSVDHSSAVLMINPQGEFAALFSGPDDAAAIARDLPLIMATR